MNEFQIISKYLKPLSAKSYGALKLQDDIYYDYIKKIAVSVDSYQEGIHFINTNDPSKFLKTILRASLSDLYCKGITPKNYFLSFGLKKNLVTKNWLKKVKKILALEQKKFKINLSGGDIIKSSKLFITVIILGESKHNPILRRGSKHNDDIYLTGNIADSYLGLSVIKKRVNYGKFNPFFKKKYYEPDLQLNFYKHLKNFASSSIDLSDGLLQDLNHLCLNSKLGATIDLKFLPLSSKCRLLIKKKIVKLKNIFSKGDDYQILFTSNPKNRTRIAKLAKKIKTKISRIGVMKRKKKITILHNAKLINLGAKKRGYIHSFQ